MDDIRVILKVSKLVQALNPSPIIPKSPNSEFMWEIQFIEEIVA